MAVTEIGVCHTPYDRQPWQEPVPTADSWTAAHDLVGIKHVRMTYDRQLLSLFEPAFRGAIDGKQKVIADFAVGPFETTTPAEVEAAAFNLVKHYGPDLESVSFDNEPGGQVGMSHEATMPDISQGGTFDWIKQVYGPLLLAFISGARLAKSGIMIDLFDADSTDVQERCMKLLDGDGGKFRWTGHNYADILGGDPAEPGGQDYSSMAGMNGKPGFLSVFESDPYRRPWYISEIGKTTGPFGGIATDSDMEIMIGYSQMMRKTYPQCPLVIFGSPKYFFTRVPVWTPPGAPQNTFCTWTHGEPVVSRDGARLAAVWAGANGKRRRAVRT